MTTGDGLWKYRIELLVPLEKYENFVEYGVKIAHLKILISDGYTAL